MKEVGEKRVCDTAPVEHIQSHFLILTDIFIANWDIQKSLKRFNSYFLYFTFNAELTVILYLKSTNRTVNIKKFVSYLCEVILIQPCRPGAVLLARAAQGRNVASQRSSGGRQRQGVGFLWFPPACLPDCPQKEQYAV